MHISSTINPLSKSDGNVAVAVFRYNDLRKFLRVSEDHKEMLTLITRAFGIAEGSRLSLQTSSLDVCHGQNVEIDESAYPLMHAYIDDVEVTIQEGPSVQEHNIDNRVAAAALPTPPFTTPEPSSSSATVSRETSAKASTSTLPPNNEGTTEEEQLKDAFSSVYAYERDREIYESRIDEGFEEAHLRSLKEEKAVSEDDTEQTVTKAKFKPGPSREPFPESSLAEIKTEKGVPPTQDKSIKSPCKETADRFEISITGPEPHQTAQFKTRGKHTVSKVLAAACKSFEIDVTRSRLFHVLTFNHDDGQEERVEVECDPDDTMARAGVTCESQLFVKLDDPPQYEEDDLTNFD